MFNICPILAFDTVQSLEATIIFYFNKRFSVKVLNDIKKALDYKDYLLKVSFDLRKQEEYLSALDFINHFKDLPFSKEYLSDAAKFRLALTIGYSDVFSMKSGRKILNKICRNKLNGDLHHLGVYRLLDVYSCSPSGNYDVSDNTNTRILHAGFALVTSEIYNPILEAFFIDFELDAETREKFLDAYLHFEECQ